MYLNKLRFPRLIILMTLLLAAVSCKEGVQVSEMAMPMRLNLLGYDGRPLESGTKAGLFASSPVSMDNIMCEIATDGSANPAQELNWALGQTDTFPVLAYSPYDPSFNGMSIVDWQFPLDQSTFESYSKANLMSGIGTGKPAVDLNIRLEHEMTSLQLRFENRISGDTIASVFAYGFSCNCRFNLFNGELSVSGDATTIAAYRPDEDVDFFCLLYPPQPVNIIFLAVMTSGRKFYIGVDAHIPTLKGGTVGISGMILDANTPESSYSQTAAVNIAQWTDTGLPDFLYFADEQPLARLDEVETDDMSYFVYCLNPVSVTYVESWGQNGCMAIFEDMSGAKKMYALCNGASLSKGNTVRGVIDGYRTQADDGPLYHYVNLSQASVYGNGSLPMTPGTIASLGDSIGQLRYRRMLFRDVSIESDIEGDMGQVVQNGNRIKVIIPGNDGKVRAGSRGDLIAHPDIVGGETVLVVYDRGSLDSIPLPVVETAFTAMTDCGVYSVDPDGNASASFSESQESVCVSYLNRAGALLTQILDCESGRLTVLKLSYSNVVTAGRDYVLSRSDKSDGRNCLTDKKLRCLKSASGLVWLLDVENMTGYILRL